jgi:hypothetical protein
MRVLLFLAVVFGVLWVADTFAYNGYYAKKIRREADREIYLVNQQVDDVVRAVAGR